VASFEIVVLKHLLVLQVSKLSLNCVQLVPQGEVVLITLLDFEDLSFQLANQQVFLVTSQMHTVVILKRNRLV
jgi:hypothetical protein